MQAAQALKRVHRHDVDVIRLLTFSAVIGVHAIAFTQPPASAPWAGVMLLLQFGREVFFALTGFVLVHSALGRPMRPVTFWRKRFAYVAIPYVAWTLIYELFHALTVPGASLTTRRLVLDLLSGNAEYHLYFLLVTMQLYLVFPAVLWFVRRTASRAWHVLVIVGVSNVVWLWMLHDVAAPTGWAGWFWRQGYELLPTYAVYVLAGCYAALHQRALDNFARRHGRGLHAAAIAAAGLGVAAYVAQLHDRVPRDANAVLQPAMMLTSFAAVVVLARAGSQWERRGRPRAALVERASDVSFGVYLAHPLVLDLLLLGGLGNDDQRVRAGVATAIAFVGAAAGAWVVAAAVRATPLSLALTGRPRRRALSQLQRPSDESPRPRAEDGDHAASPTSDEPRAPVGALPRENAAAGRRLPGGAIGAPSYLG